LSSVAKPRVTYVHCAFWQNETFVENVVLVSSETVTVE